MVNDWLGDVLHGVGGTISDLSREWRTGYRFAAVFGLLFVVGLTFLGVTAFDPQPFPGSWWFYGSYTFVTGLATGFSYWIGRRSNSS